MYFNILGCILCHMGEYYTNEPQWLYFYTFCCYVNVTGFSFSTRDSTTVHQTATQERLSLKYENVLSMWAWRVRNPPTHPPTHPASHLHPTKLPPLLLFFLPPCWTGSTGSHWGLDAPSDAQAKRGGGCCGSLYLPQTKPPKRGASAFACANLSFFFFFVLCLPRWWYYIFIFFSTLKRVWFRNVSVQRGERQGEKKNHFFLQGCGFKGETWSASPGRFLRFEISLYSLACDRRRRIYFFPFFFILFSFIPSEISNLSTLQKNSRLSVL